MHADGNDHVEEDKEGTVRRREQKEAQIQVCAAVLRSINLIRKDDYIEMQLNWQT